MDVEAENVAPLNRHWQIESQSETTSGIGTPILPGTLRLVDAIAGTSFSPKVVERPGTFSGLKRKQSGMEPYGDGELNEAENSIRSRKSQKVSALTVPGVVDRDKSSLSEQVTICYHETPDSHRPIESFIWRKNVEGVDLKELATVLRIPKGYHCRVSATAIAKHSILIQIHWHGMSRLLIPKISTESFLTMMTDS